MKKRTPFNPAKTTKKLQGYLGVPNAERQARSRSGFETEQITDGRYVSRERAMLTHPALLIELYNQVVRKHQEAGEALPEKIHIPKMTPSDRATAAYRNILWAYLKVSAEVSRGTVKIVDYEGAPAAQGLNRVPLSQNQFDSRRFYAWIREQHGLLVVTDFLDSICKQMNPELVADGDTTPTKAEIGQSLTGAENARDAKNAADGALALACRVLSEAARDFVIIERRHRSEIQRLERSASRA